MNHSLKKNGSGRRRIFIGALAVVGAMSWGAWLVLYPGPGAVPQARGSGRPQPPLRSAANPEDSPRSAPITRTASRVPAKPESERADTESAPVSVQDPAVAALPSGVPSKAATVPLPEPTPQSRQLMSALCRLDQPSIPRTPEQVAEWKQNLQQLIAQGAPAVRAIREFLEKNVDLDFGPGNALGYSSARAAMFDALVQIGGAEGLTGTLQTLQNTADPREIAVLAQNLEKLEPGSHRQEAIEAAREALAMAAGGKLDGADVAPLFEVLRSYGDTSVLTDLMQAAKQWNYYSAIALAQLPDGAGIPALIEMSQGASGGKLNALEMLAQVSTKYPEARAALLEQARANKITPNLWPYLAPLLAGDLYHYQDSAFDSPIRTGDKRPNSGHVVLGNQHFYTAPAFELLTPEDINQRLALIEELKAVTGDPAALKALDQSKDLIERRRPQTAAVSRLGE